MATTISRALNQALCLASVALAPTLCLGAGESVPILVADATADSAAAERRVLRTPQWGSSIEAPDLARPGVHVLDSGGGITVYVEAFSVTGGTPTATDNDFTRIDVAAQALPMLGDGTTIELLGTFDWTEPNALNSWVAADFAVIPPPGVADVTVRAAALGDAVIQGPGELTDPSIYYEGFLQLFGGSYQGWTIENLDLRGFDWPLGMYHASGGTSSSFDNVTVRSNRIEMVVDAPGNSGTGTGEAPQNIGLHYAFGRNQAFLDNEIVIPGTGINTGTELAASVAMQCNSSGGSVYDGLLIAGNTIRVTGAPVNGAERLWGIWENGWSHSSNIEISGNLFVNEAPDNDPATNLQRAFWVTSHSSATTTVAYADNLATGANIAIHWIGDTYQSTPPATVEPVLVVANTLVDNGTAVWVHTDDLAPDPGGTPTNMSKGWLRFNRIVGNGLGVRSDDAEATAEDNWWGCADGPGAGDCDGVAYAGTAGYLDADPWLVLSLAMAPDAVATGGQATATADLHLNSDGIDTSTDGAVPDGTPVDFAATGGTMSPVSTDTTVGAAASTYTAGSVPGEFAVTATVDLATAEAPILVTGEAALEVAMSPELQIIDDGETAELTITVANAGPQSAGVEVVAELPDELLGVGWTCSGAGGGSCTASGSGDIDDDATLPAGASVTYVATGSAPDPFVGVLPVTGSVILPPFLVDPDPSDNTATAEIRSVRIFSDGFESGDTGAWSSVGP